MKQSRKASRISILNTYYKCIMYNPLNYEGEDIATFYYDKIMSYIENNKRCYVYKVKEGYRLFVDGRSVTGE